MSSTDSAGRARRVTDADNLVPPRMIRLRRLAWLLDRSIPIAGYRIGLDPIIGLLPGGGDVLGGFLSLVILYDSARLGIPVKVLMRMLGNILLETLVGIVPILGDFFDFAWQANIRNLRLAEKHFDPNRQERPVSRIGIGIVAIALVAILGAATLSILIIQALWRLISQLG